MRDRLGVLARALAVVSVLGALGAAATAGVVQATEEAADRDRTGPEEELDLDGWATVTGPADAAGEAAAYRVPAGGDWERQSATYVVSYRDAADQPYATGRAPAFYYGNDCSDGSTRMPGGWAVLARPEAGTDAAARAAVASSSARRWARGFGTGPDDEVAPISDPELEEIELADGTEATSARVELDMSVFDGACLGDEAEVTAIAYVSGTQVKTLVVARYLGVDGAIGDEEYAAVLASLEP